MAGEKAVEQLQYQQDSQETRLSTLESEVRHVTAAVGKLTESVSTGFREFREVIESAQTRGDQRTKELHARLDEQNKVVLSRGQVSWPLVLSFITCAIVIGGIFVAFVRLTQTPIREAVARNTARMEIDDSRELTDARLMGQVTERFVAFKTAADLQTERDHARFAKLEEHQKWWFQNMPTVIATLQEQNKDQGFEIEKLHRVSDKCVEDRGLLFAELAASEATLDEVRLEQQNRREAVIGAAETRGKVDQALIQIQEELTSLSQRVNSARPDPFYGKQGEQLDERLSRIEEWSRTITGAGKKE